MPDSDQITNRETVMGADKRLAHIVLQTGQLKALSRNFRYLGISGLDVVVIRPSSGIGATGTGGPGKPWPNPVLRGPTSGRPDHNQEATIPRAAHADERALSLGGSVG